MRTKTGRSLMTACSLVALTLAVNADDWPNFRGPNHDGISTETGLKTTWTAAIPLLWERNVGSAFSSFADFKTAFAKAGTTRFGSGWAWLGVKDDGGLCVCSTPNQDNPLMKDQVECPCIPILGLDVWEHAYYLNYQNRRPDYIAAWWGVVNWSAVADRFAQAKSLAAV